METTKELSDLIGRHLVHQLMARRNEGDPIASTIGTVETDATSEDGFYLKVGDQVFSVVVSEQDPVDFQ